MQKEQFGTNFVETCVDLKLPILSVCPHGSEITVQEHPTLMRDAFRSIAGQTCHMCVCALVCVCVCVCLCMCVCVCVCMCVGGVGGCGGVGVGMDEWVWVCVHVCVCVSIHLCVLKEGR